MLSMAGRDTSPLLALNSKPTRKTNASIVIGSVFFSFTSTADFHGEFSEPFARSIPSQPPDTPNYHSCRKCVNCNLIVDPEVVFVVAAKFDRGRSDGGRRLPARMQMSPTDLALVLQHVADGRAADQRDPRVSSVSVSFTSTAFKNRRRHRHIGLTLMARLFIS